MNLIFIENKEVLYYTADVKVLIVLSRQYSILYLYLYLDTFTNIYRFPLNNQFEKLLGKFILSGEQPSLFKRESSSISSSDFVVLVFQFPVAEDCLT